MMRILQTRLALILLLPLFVSACLYIDIGTVLSLKKLDPYSIDLVSSRAAVLLPADIAYADHVIVTIRVVSNDTVLQEEDFALQVIKGDEDLPGIDPLRYPRRPLIVRLAKEDYQRAISMQLALSAMDKNHQWVEPDTGTTGSGKAEETLDRNPADHKTASGDVTINWSFSIGEQGRDRYCHRHKKIALTAWVRINGAPAYRRVVHGLPLKRVYGKKAMAKLCAITIK